MAGIASARGNPAWWTPRVALLAVVCSLLATAAWIDFTPIHRFHTADSIVYSLVSLYQWTPQFWEQDRLGMLFPLLAMPCQTPLENLLLQGAMTTLVALAGFFLLGYYVAGRNRGVAIGALSSILFLSFVKLDQQFDYLIQMHYYATSVSFGLLGLILLGRWERGSSRMNLAVGVTLIMAALWMNPSAAFALGPLILVRRWCFRLLPAYFDETDDAQESAKQARIGAVPTGGRTRGPLLTADELVGLSAVAVGLAISLTISWLSPVHVAYRVIGPGEWLASMRGVWNYPSLHWRWFRAVEITGLVGLVSLASPAGRATFGASARVVAGLWIAAAVQFAFMASLDHVHRTHYGHYVFAADFLWQGGLVAFAVIQISSLIDHLPAARWIPGLATAGVLLAAIANHGPASLGSVRAALDESLGRYTSDVLDAQCTHISGDFWHVWPAVFHVNMRLHDRQSPQTVWGITFRSGPTAPAWKSVPWQDVRVAEILGDEAQSECYRQQHGVPALEPEEERTTIRVLRPAEPVASKPTTWR